MSTPLGPPHTLDTLASGKPYKPRPGMRYVLKPPADGAGAGSGSGAPELLGTLRPPTDALVMEFDRIAQDGTRHARRLERLVRQKVAADRLARLLAVGEVKTEEDRRTLDGRTLADLDAELDALDGQIAEADPTNPDSDAYYLRSFLRKAAVALDVVDAEGNPADLLAVDGIEVRVADQAGRDFTALAFSPTD